MCVLSSASQCVCRFIMNEWMPSGLDLHPVLLLYFYNNNNLFMTLMKCFNLNEQHTDLTMLEVNN